MWKILQISYKFHIFIALILRLVLIVYGEFHDKISEVPYTDIDYRVFTDAARYVWNGESPYNRHTYRYTPLIAFLVSPNVFFHSCFGKVLFSLVDIGVGLLLRSIVRYNRQKYEKHKVSQVVSDETKCLTNGSQRLRKRKSKTKIKHVSSDENHKQVQDYVPNYCMLFWIYNPVSVIITTRGNCDSLAAFLVLMTLYLIQCKEKYFIAGLLHGIAIHVRLYPIVYSLSLYMYLSQFGSYSTDKRITHDNKVVSTQKIVRNTIFKRDYLLYLIPNLNQLQLIFGCFLSLIASVGFFYYLYGYNFLYETYIYHLVRKDTRHNFSLFFYIQYLTADIKNIGVWQKVLSNLPQLVLLLVLSVRYGLNKFTLPFSILTQTIVIVAYNSVLTSQYFVWILAILPLTLWQFNLTLKSAIALVAIWIVAQLAWLLPAYLLEFQGQNTFLYIWIQSVSFFCANMAILGRLIKCYMHTNN